MGKFTYLLLRWILFLLCRLFGLKDPKPNAAPMPASGPPPFLQKGPMVDIPFILKDAVLNDRIHVILERVRCPVCKAVTAEWLQEYLFYSPIKTNIALLFKCTCKDVSIKFWRYPQSYRELAPFEIFEQRSRIQTLLVEQAESFLRAHDWNFVIASCAEAVKKKEEKWDSPNSTKA